MKGTQSQLHFLLVQHTDFVFSVLCEELGMLGALALFVLLGVIFVRACAQPSWPATLLGG